MTCGMAAASFALSVARWCVDVPRSYAARGNILVERCVLGQLALIVCEGDSKL
jgi:hypothetical protein